MIDLTQLPPPDVLEALDFETLFQSRKARLLAAAPVELRDGLAVALQLDSEPLTMLLQEFAYNELLQRQRINEAARASLLAYAEKSDLDNRAADYGVQRLLLQPADPDTVPPTPAEWENDTALRRRCQMALEGLSVAGSRGAYLFHTLSASADIADASVDSPRFEALELSAELRRQLPADVLVLRCSYDAGLSAPLPGDVAIAVLPRQEVDAAPLLARALEVLSADDVRPLTDRPRALAGQPQVFNVVATVETENGPDADVVMRQARQRLDQTLAAARRLGGVLPRSALFAALHVPGVRRVDLIEPAADLQCDVRHYPGCRRIELQRAQP